MTEAPTALHAIASLLIVLGMIGAIAWLLRKFAFGGLAAMIPQGKSGKRMAVMESLWLDARYRAVIVRDGATEHTLVLGPERALQLGQKPSGLPHDR